MNLVNCLDVNAPLAPGSPTQMLRLPWASKIHATLPPAGAAVSSLGNGALSADSIVNDGVWARAAWTKKATPTRDTIFDKAATSRSRVRCVVFCGMAGWLTVGRTGAYVEATDIVRRCHRNTSSV